MEQEAERSLIRRCAEGDHQAFRALVENHQGFAYSLAFRFIRDEDQSEDIVQEAFIRVWKNVDRYDPQFRFKTWLGRIVTNLSLDYQKSARKRFEVAESKEYPVQPEAPDTNQIEVSELREILYRLADQLAGKQRAVFFLRDLEQLGVDEVCAMLGMTPGNMKSSLFYARMKVREGLRQYYREKLPAVVPGAK
jgi:RNA polymerase sigma-70 factor (ECF subfamily)